MIIKQMYLPCLSQASYLIGDLSSGRAVVVDPRRDIEEYLEEAGSLGLSIGDVLLTHVHADFLAGHLELRARTGARIHMGSRAQVEFPIERHSSGSRIRLGEVELEILETPGHTPESICIAVHEPGRDPAVPHALLAGDTLFIGDVGRPDLMAALKLCPEDMAAMLYDSLQERILKLPDSVLIYPGHGAGSACGRKLSSETWSTLGEQRKTNYALQPMSREAFVRELTETRPAPPTYFFLDSTLNRKEHPTLEVTMENSLRPLTSEEVLRRVNQGAQLLDTRDADEFAREHVQGSFNIGLSGRFAHWAGTVLDLERPIVLLCTPGSEPETVMRLGRIGIDSVAGYVEGGIETFKGRSDLLRSFPRVTAEQLDRDFERLTAERQILDVRGQDEWDSMRIKDAILVPLPELRARLKDVPRDRPLLVHCLSGYRSAVASSILEAGGFKVSDLKGGIQAFSRQSRQHLEIGTGCSIE